MCANVKSVSFIRLRVGFGSLSSSNSLIKRINYTFILSPALIKSSGLAWLLDILNSLLQINYRNAVIYRDLRNQSGTRIVLLDCLSVCLSENGLSVICART